MAAAPEAWLRATFALVHGEDADRRKAAVEAWKAVHVDPEWADFSLTTCSDGAPWPEVLSALQESAPFGASARVVVVPCADNLLAKPKELPGALKAWFAAPPEGLCLLLVARNTLSAGPGKPLGAKPWTDWAKEGRILKTGALEAVEIGPFLESEARALGIRLEGPVPELLAQRLGGNPGLLKRALEVLDLLAEDRRVTEAMVDQVTFRLADQKAFAWSEAWKKGDVSGALRALRQGLEDGEEPLMLLGQARREVERAVRYAEAEARGLRGAELTGALGLSPKQAFLLDGYRNVAGRLRLPGLKALVGRMNQTERDLKGQALSRSETPMLELTVALCRAWRG